jgi:hypothetical protein
VEQDWRGPINQLLYGLIYTEHITEDTVRWNADDAVHYQTLGLGPAAYYDAIAKALDSGEELDGLQQLPQFGQTQVAEFLRAVAHRLDSLRPWPEPKIIQITDPAAWTEFGRAVPIAQLNSSILEVSNILRKGFTPVTDTQPRQHVLILRLASGETVALRGTYGPADALTLLTDTPEDPAQVIEHFIVATGLPAHTIEAISPGTSDG